MREKQKQGATQAWGRLLPGVAILVVLLTPAAALWEEPAEGNHPSSRCSPGDREGGLVKAGEAAGRGETTIALRCIYHVFLDAEAAGDAAVMVRVGDFLQRLGVQRYLKLSIQSAYLRAAEHARHAREWPVLAAVATRLVALGELEGASTMLAELCAGTAAGDPNVPCDPIRGTPTATRHGEQGPPEHTGGNGEGQPEKQ